MNTDKSRVQMVEIDAEDADQRIDNYLLRILKGVPRSRIYRLLRKGEVRVNRGRVRADYRLAAGDQVRIPPVTTAAAKAGPGPAPGRQLAGRILYEDDRLLVVDKPAGMAVHGGSGLSFGVIEALRAARPEAKFLELVHRLDRETSGCLILAKRRSALRALHEQLRENRMDKRYFALVRGRVAGRQRVDAPLRRNQLRGGERMVQVAEDGKPARTDFSLAESLPGASLVEAVLHTGRTHQIRVHAAHLGHPLAGDDKYGDPDFNRALKARGLNRLFLHAHLIAFDHPATGERVQVSAPLDAELHGVLEKLHSDPIIPAARES